MATLFDSASLVMVPSGYKDDKLYSIKPTNGSGDFTFSRDGAGASPATRVNASGLIEKGRENLLTYSNDFSNSAWTKNTASVTGGQSGYDGTNNAWRLESTGAGNPQILQTTSNTLIKAHSIYAKAGNVSILRIWVGVTKEFDLSAGTTSSTNCKITDVGGGWYRCEVFDVFSNLNPFFPATASGEYIYIQDAQLEQGLVATDYIETTTAPVSAGLLGDMPRLDYSGGATCPSLLLEPSRVNSITQSEYSGNYTAQNISFTDNFATSPEGYDNAFKALPNTANAQHIFFRSGMGNAADTYTQSIFAKANGYNFCFIRFDLPTKYAFFDLQNGTTAYADSGVTSTITDMGDGWYRCTATMTTTQYANAVIGVAEAGDSQADKSFVGDGTNSVLFYGHQSELGSYPTSYIPTYGSASTRAKDYMVTSTLSNDILPTGSFSVMWEADLEQSDIQFDDLFNISGSSAGSRWEARVNNQVRFQGGGYISGDNPNSTIVGTISSKKFGATFSASQIKLYTDGALIATFNGSYDTDYETIGNNIQGTSVIEKQILLFPSVLTESEMIALTTI